MALREENRSLCLKASVRDNTTFLLQIFNADVTVGLKGESSALFFTFLARRAKFRVFIVSRAHASAGDTQQIMTVRAFPPRESCKHQKRLLDKSGPPEHVHVWQKKKEGRMRGQVS
jgi:hypothetical protein